ncbi:MAG: NUDIX hydrolase [Candidatus Nucleicultricaceae bacterium]
MKNIVLVVECILEWQEKFLVIERPQGVHAGGMLAFPGGKVEDVDAQTNTHVLETAVKREILEEVGLSLHQTPQYVMNSFFKDSRGNTILDVIFYARLEGSQPSILASPREVASFHWMTTEDLKAAPHCPSWVLTYLEAAKKFHP